MVPQTRWVGGRYPGTARTITKRLPMIDHCTRIAALLACRSDGMTRVQMLQQLQISEKVFDRAIAKLRDRHVVTFKNVALPSVIGDRRSTKVWSLK